MFFKIILNSVRSYQKLTSLYTNYRNRDSNPRYGLLGTESLKSFTQNNKKSSPVILYWPRARRNQQRDFHSEPYILHTKIKVKEPHKIQEIINALTARSMAIPNHIVHIPRNSSAVPLPIQPHRAPYPIKHIFIKKWHTKLMFGSVRLS